MTNNSSTIVGTGSGKGMKRYTAPPSTTSLGYPPTTADPSEARKAKPKLNQPVSKK
jgi:hypothetical protein